MSDGKGQESYLTLVGLRRLLELNGIRRYRDSAESRHRMVMALFPHVQEAEARQAMGVLFRCERNRNESTVLIRSNRAPATFPGIRSLSENLLRFDGGSQIRFRTTVSPLRRSQGKERHIRDFDELESWIEERLSGGLKSLELIQLKEEEVRRSGSKNYVKLVQLDGVATVDNADVLSDILRLGVGRNRSYGAGLLTLAAL